MFYCLVFHFVQASSYQNDFLFDYSIKMSGFMPIYRLCVVAFRSACIANIDFQPLRLKSGLKEGGDSGDQNLKYKSFTFSHHKQFIIYMQ
jgi:hypothetical protein